ncbi:MAG TPA: translation initiation factor IF-2 associated domain-containing protein, partial [Steroidobacteraceae bacterium]|nr:translation initiation factor IF-2 associated domain-containing protein [Steroidobacteraceae bacterium]
MAEVTVTQFAEVLKVPVEKLLSQLDEAGIKVSSANATISDEAKMELLTFLRRSHGRAEDAVSAPRKITLKRKQQGEIKVATGQGRARTVNVEVRRKKTYLNRSVLEEQARKQQEELDRQREVEQEARAAEERLEQERQAAERAEKERIEQEAQARAAAEAQREAEERTRLETEARERAESERREREREREKEKPLPTPPAAARAPAEKADERRTRYNREELHVSGDASSRLKKRRQAGRSRRAVNVSFGTQHGFEKPAAPVVRQVQIPETITVGELAQRMAVKANEVIKS